MLEILRNKIAENPDLKSVFYLGEAICLFAFIAIAWLLRPKSPETQFNVREADLLKQKSKKLNPHQPDLLAQAKIPKHEPLRLTGIRIQGAPHEILGIRPQASKAEIQKAYRDLMKQYHPDKISTQTISGSQVWNDAQKIAEAINQAKDEMLKKAK